MSRLEDLIHRFTSQRNVLDYVIRRMREDGFNRHLVGGIGSEDAAIAVELGLGSGRTYDHLREKLPKGIDVFAFDRAIETHPGLEPAPELAVLGEIAETLPAFAEKYRNRAVLVHLDIGSNKRSGDNEVHQALAPHIAKLLRPGGYLVSDRPVDLPELRAKDVSGILCNWSYYLYQTEARALWLAPEASRQADNPLNQLNRPFSRSRPSSPCSTR